MIFKVGDKVKPIDEERLKWEDPEYYNRVFTVVSVSGSYVEVNGRLAKSALPIRFISSTIKLINDKELI